MLEDSRTTADDSGASATLTSSDATMACRACELLSTLASSRAFCGDAVASDTTVMQALVGQRWRGLYGGGGLTVTVQ